MTLGLCSDTVAVSLCSPKNWFFTTISCAPGVSLSVTASLPTTTPSIAIVPPGNAATWAATAAVFGGRGFGVGGLGPGADGVPPSTRTSMSLPSR